MESRALGIRARFKGELDLIKYYLHFVIVLIIFWVRYFVGVVEVHCACRINDMIYIHLDKVLAKIPLCVCGGGGHWGARD